jgi:hypothetical protein
MPTSTSTPRSSSGRRTRVAYSEPMPALMRATGPSRPAAPPEPMVTAEATIFSGVTRGRR